MLVQIYEISSPEEAAAASRFGVDHVGVLVGGGAFPREQSFSRAREIFSAIVPPSKGSALCLSADVDLIKKLVTELTPSILHLGASIDLLTPDHVRELKRAFPKVKVMRSIPVVDESALAIAKSYDGIADILLLDSHKPGDKQIGALGITHSWDLDRKIVESVKIPVIVAGGLGPGNVVDAIKATHPAGVDSKTKTDKQDGSHTKALDKVKRFVEIVKEFRLNAPW